MSTNPSYLRTAQDGLVNNFRDWGIPLGRRMRSLRLWLPVPRPGGRGLAARVRRDQRTPAGWRPGGRSPAGSGWHRCRCRRSASATCPRPARRRGGAHPPQPRARHGDQRGRPPLPHAVGAQRQADHPRLDRQPQPNAATSRRSGKSCRRGPKRRRSAWRGGRPFPTARSASESATRDAVATSPATIDESGSDRLRHLTQAAGLVDVDATASGEEEGQELTRDHGRDRGHPLGHARGSRTGCAPGRGSRHRRRGRRGRPPARPEGPGSDDSRQRRSGRRHARTGKPLATMAIGPCWKSAVLIGSTLA